MSEQPTAEPTWGFHDPAADGAFTPLPIAPMRHLGPPPFEVTLPGGEVRLVVERISGEAAQCS